MKVLPINLNSSGSSSWDSSGHETILGAGGQQVVTATSQGCFPVWE